MNDSIQALRRIVRQEIRSFIREILDSILESPVVHARPMRRSDVKYRGEGPAKKAVRLRVWETVKKYLGPERFLTGPHLFLPSFEGGDASVLQGMNVPCSSMIAIDWDEEALAEFSANYPHVPTASTDVATVLYQDRSLESVYLDFTAQISDPVLERIVMAAKSVKDGGIVACTFSFGREKGIPRWKHPADSCKSRMEFLEASIQSKLGFHPQILAKMSYQSQSVMGRGSNMGTLVFRMVPHEDNMKPVFVQCISLYDFYRDAEQYVKDSNLYLLFNYSREKAEKLRERVSSYPHPRPV